MTAVASSHDTDSTTDAISEQLVALLEFYPKNLPILNRTVFTAQPALWQRQSTALPLTVVNILELIPSPGTADCAQAREEAETLIQRLDALNLPGTESAIVLDHTVPLHMHTTRESSGLGTLLPQAIFSGVPDSIDIQAVLIAWAAGLEHTHAAAAILPQPLLQDVAAIWLHEWMEDRHLPLSAIIELPSDALRDFTPTPASLVYFDANRNEVYFDVLTSRGDLVNAESRPWFAALQKRFFGSPSAGRTGAKGLPVRGAADSTTAEQPETESRPMLIAEAVVQCTAEEDPIEVSEAAKRTERDLLALRKRFERLGEIKPLGQICDIAVGLRQPRKVAEASAGVVLLEPRLFGENGINLDGASLVEDRGIPEEAWAKPNDILLLHDPGRGSRVVCNTLQVPAVLSDGITAIRLTTDDATPGYIVDVLRSAPVRAVLSQRLHAAALDREQLDLAAWLSDLPVPVLARERMLTLASVQQASVELREKADDLEAQCLDLFRIESGKEFGQHLDRLRQRSKLLAVSMGSLESLELQIAQTFPYPLAFGYRLLESAADPRDKYKEQFRFAENMLAFLASLALVLLKPEDRGTLGIDPERGMTIGKWHAILGGAMKVFKDYRDNPLASGFIGLRNRGFLRDTEEILNERNEWAHMRDSTLVEDVREAADKRQLQLRSLVQGLDFLTDFPIRRVEDMNKSRRSGWEFQCAVYRGDHPGLPRESVLLSDALSEIPEGADLKSDLFLDCGQGQWLSLYPLIRIMPCPQCKWEETFFVDEWNREVGTARLRSFERAHMRQETNLADSFAPWVAEKNSSGENE